MIVIGASSGGIDALEVVVAGLPSDLPAAVFVVQHIAAYSTNYLPKMLDRQSRLAAKLAVDGTRFEYGHIYVAPADRHLLVDKEQMYLSQGPRENRVRPAIDPLFRSAALSLRQRVIGVILSGSLDDGTSGLEAVKAGGGLAVVQRPTDALTAEMPQSAIDHVDVDHVVSAAEMGGLLDRLVRSEATVGTDGNSPDFMAEAVEREVEILRDESGGIEAALQLGRMVPASCPECGGPLWEVDGKLPRFRCHTGHAFTARHLAAGLEEAEEQSLWVALRVMEERARMLKRLAKKDAERGHSQAQRVFSDKAREAEEHVERLKGLLGTRQLRR